MLFAKSCNVICTQYSFYPTSHVSASVHQHDHSTEHPHIASHRAGTARVQLLLRAVRYINRAQVNVRIGLQSDQSHLTLATGQNMNNRLNVTDQRSSNYLVFCQMSFVCHLNETMKRVHCPVTHSCYSKPFSEMENGSNGRYSQQHICYPYTLSGFTE